MNKNVFVATMKLEKIINQLPDDCEILTQLEDIHSELLQVGRYLDTEKFVNKESITLKSDFNLPIYTRINIIYNYDNGYSLVEDTSGEVHYISTKIIE